MPLRKGLIGRAEGLFDEITVAKDSFVALEKISGLASRFDLLPATGTPQQAATDQVRPPPLRDPVSDKYSIGLPRSPQILAKSA